MKRLAVITTSLLLTLSAGAGSVAAYAEGDETRYPANEEFKKPLTFDDGLKDYDIDDGAYYFLNGETYVKWENGERTEFEPEEDYVFPESATDLIIDNYYYYFDEDGALTAYDKSSKLPAKTFEGEYSLLKNIDGTAYAVKDNVLYSFNGAEEPTVISLEYVDYHVADEIYTGQAEKDLKGGYALTFVKVLAGSFMTKVDLTALDREKFVSDSETKGVETKIAENDITALLLCYTGNAAIIAVGDTKDGTSYIVRNDPSNIEVLDSQTVADHKTEVDFTSATIIGNGIYVSPFTVIGTTLIPDAAGTIVTVKYKVEYEGVLNSAYYEVEYTDADGNVKTGYVAEGHLSKFIFEDKKPPETVADPEYSEKTNVTTVLLILAVVVLVLIAVGYIIYTSTVGKKGKGKKAKSDKKAEQAE